MIISGFNDNLVRIKFLHFSVSSLYHQTKNSEYRNHGVSKESPFSFDVSVFEKVREEEAIAELLICWSVVSIESLVNHIIAEKTNNDFVSKALIENPKKTTDGLSNNKTFRTDLQCKIQIVGGDSNYSREIAESLLELIEIRNTIIHDKPFRYEEFEGDVEMTRITKYKDVSTRLRYEDLERHYKILDNALEFLSIQEAEDEVKSFRFMDLLISTGDR